MGSVSIWFDGDVEQLRQETEWRNAMNLINQNTQQFEVSIERVDNRTQLVVRSEDSEFRMTVSFKDQRKAYALAEFLIENSPNVKWSSNEQPAA